MLLYKEMEKNRSVGKITDTCEYVLSSFSLIVIGYPKTVLSDWAVPHPIERFWSRICWQKVLCAGGDHLCRFRGNFIRVTLWVFCFFFLCGVWQVLDSLENHDCQTTLSTEDVSGEKRWSGPHHFKRLKQQNNVSLLLFSGWNLCERRACVCSLDGTCFCSRVRARAWTERTRMERVWRTEEEEIAQALPSDCIRLSKGVQPSPVGA